MHDDTDERRLRDIAKLGETGGVIHHGDGTTTQVGSKYGGVSGRASSSDGREYRDDGFGRMLRDPMAEYIPDVEFKGPQCPTTTPSTPTWNWEAMPGARIRLQLKLGLVFGVFFLLGQAYEGLDYWLHTSPLSFVPAFTGGLALVWKLGGGWLRTVLLWLGLAFILLKVILALDQTPRPGQAAAVKAERPATAVVR